MSDRERLSPPTQEYRPTRDPEGVDNSMRNLALAAVAIAAVVMGGVYVLSGRHAAGVPVIEADPRPIRIKPTDPGGMQVADAGDAGLGGKDGAEADRLLPPPEAPAPQVLQQQARAAALPPAMAPAAMAPMPKAPAPPLVAPPAAVPVPPVMPPRAAPPVDAQGRVEVQLAALTSEAAAHAEWAALGRRLPELMAGHAAKIARGERDGRVFWRLRTGPFADIAAATAFCGKLRAKGGACTIARF